MMQASGGTEQGTMGAVHRGQWHRTLGPPGGLDTQDNVYFRGNDPAMGRR